YIPWQRRSNKALQPFSGGVSGWVFCAKNWQLCSAADEPWLWDLITLAPTPAHAMLLSEEQVQRGLKAHRLRCITATEVLACLQAPALPGAPGSAEAAQAHGGFLLPCQRVLAEQLQARSQQVSTLLRTMADEPGAGGESLGCGNGAVSAWGRTEITAWLFAE